ncbi:nucleoside phosphatase family-domain-containing protein [Dipodascopsis tothii]|uniref:nucleoside phosphatase family-domain-containing protein n=1 Tax=Dipodascopsis tothii TaxID=44089 RepID=UPI0034CF18EB
MPSVPTNYGIVIDAGSSGSRIHIYSWLSADAAGGQAGGRNQLPQVTRGDPSWSMKIKPGISTFAGKADAVGRDHLAALLGHAQSIVPRHKHEQTPIFLYATAGMRLLADEDQHQILTNACQFIMDSTKFHLPADQCAQNVRVIDGETEGLLGWLALNYMLGALDEPASHAHGKGHSTYGFLDMGGASAQVAFAPNATETEKHLEDLYTVRMRTLSGADQIYNIFVTSWLGYGANEARRRYLELLPAAEAAPTAAAEPSAAAEPMAMIQTAAPTVATRPADAVAGGSGKSLIQGTGSFDECMAATYPLLSKDMPCNDDPCLFGGVHAPAIDFDVNRFIGVSEYWHTSHDLLLNPSAAGKGGDVFDIKIFTDRVQAVCNGSADSKQSALCFKGVYILTVLQSGFGIPVEEAQKESEDGAKALVDSAKDKGFMDTHFTSVDEINGVELSWTLGKMVLHAAAQIPAADTAPALANAAADAAGAAASVPRVGFGPSKDPARFHAERLLVGADEADAGVNATALPPAFLDGAAEAAGHSLITARRLPGLVLFVGMFAFMAFLMAGKVWRRKFLAGVASKTRRRRPADVPGPPSESTTPVMFMRELE